MSPTIVLENGKPALCVGAAGGSRIVTATQQVAMNTASTNEILEKDEVVKQLMDRLGDGR